MGDDDVPVQGRFGKPGNDAPPLGEDDIRATLDGLPSPAARKRWLMDRYSAGLMDAEEVAFWFYSYALRDA